VNSKKINGGPRQEATANTKQIQFTPELGSTEVLDLDHGALDEFLHWCDDCGVVASKLIRGQWVMANAPHRCYSDRSLGILDKGNAIVAHDFLTGETHSFGGGA